MRNQVKLSIAFLILTAAFLTVVYLRTPQNTPRTQERHLQQAPAQEAAGDVKKPQKPVQKIQQSRTDIARETGAGELLRPAPEAAIEPMKVQEQKEEPVLKIKPETVTITVGEGGREKSSFKIINTGTHEAYINLYKSNPNCTAEEVQKRVEEITKYRKDKLSPKEGKTELEKAALFSGAPWLTYYPYYAVLKPNEPRSIEVTVNAKDVEAGEYKVALIVTGIDKKELLVVPVYAEVFKAPKLKISKLEINDGLTPGTKGNADGVANPGEIISITATVKNYGGGLANDVKVKLIPDTVNLRIVGMDISEIPYLGGYGEVKVNFTAEVLPTADSEIPPTVTLAAIDREGTKWEENFYLGDPDKIHYPTGLIVEHNTDGQDDQKQ